MNILALLTLAIGAREDEKLGEISNKLTYLAATIGILYSIIFGEILLSIIVGLIVLITTMWLWSKKIIGGGDAKILTAISFFEPLTWLFPTAFILLLMTGISAIIEAKYYPKKQIKLGTHFLLNYIILYIILLLQIIYL